MTAEPRVRPRPGVTDVDTGLLVIGGGACGLVAALTMAEAGVPCLVVERDATLAGSTALSSGMIPAAGSAAQRRAAVIDSPALQAADIQRKAKGRARPELVAAVVDACAPTVDWLIAAHGIDLVLVTDFLYPGHSAHRMHAPPSRDGADLIGGLTRAAAAAGVDVVTEARAETLFTADGRVAGAAIERADGARETIGAGAVLLACNGFGGAPEMVRRHIPEMADALYFGHVGNQGDALVWGAELGAATEHMGAYQGHGSVAHPHGILITWALVMGGAIQVNREGRRFADESQGYSEQAVRVVGQPGGEAWIVHDERLHQIGMGFPDYRQADAMGAVRVAADVGELAVLIGAAPTDLAATLDAARPGRCPFGRNFANGQALTPPFRAIRVVGTLFHTQGGLRIDRRGRVQDKAGRPIAGLFAGGGAAVGVSGPEVDGYLSGNGLLTAVTLGRLAALAAIEDLKQ
jgi:fumarate reductase flavoprotein subunit